MLYDLVMKTQPAIMVKDNSQSEKLQDTEVIRRVLGGDVNAFEVLVVRYSGFVHSVVARHVPNDRVEEVAQDVFISSYRTLASYSGRSGFKWWLSRIAVRRCCDFWRARGKERETPFSQLSDEHQQWIEGVQSQDSSCSIHEAADRIEARELLDYALGHLSSQDRTALTLVYLEGVPAGEAARLLGWNSVLLRVRVHRAKGRLQKIISGLLDKRGSDEKE
ncbi:MAG: RNA polymerase sigma factor [Syntrophobacteraceae bacterium]